MKMYFLQKTASKLVKFGLCSSISDLQTPIGGPHPMLYFPSQIQRNIVLCYARGGADPCQDFSGEFEQSFARILNNLLPRFWTIFCQDFGIRSLYPLSNPTSLSHLYQVNMFGCVTNNVIYLQGHSRHSLSAYQHPVALSCKPTPRKLYITMQALFKMGTMWVLYVASIYLFISI